MFNLRLCAKVYERLKKDEKLLLLREQLGLLYEKQGTKLNGFGDIHCIKMNWSTNADGLRSENLRPGAN